MLLGTSGSITNIPYKMSKLKDADKSAVFITAHSLDTMIMMLKIVYGNVELVKPYIRKIIVICETIVGIQKTGMHDVTLFSDLNGQLRNNVET